MNLSFLKSILLGGCATLLATTTLSAQSSYTMVDLTAASNQATAYAASGGQAAGTNVVPADPNAFHAFLWAGDGGFDLHPAALLGTTDYNMSTIQGFSGGLQVGWGLGPNTNGRSAALIWHDTAASAALLNATFSILEAQAFSTDGAQIVGYAAPNSNKATAHAMVWNAQTGAATDLGDGGNGAMALGVARGQQVGFIYQSKSAVAALWSGTSRSLTVIHPKNATISEAAATDGSRQVGFMANDVRSPAEGVKTNRYYYAVIWSGTAASARTLSTYPLGQGVATGMNASVIVGYGFDGKGLGTRSTYHAMV